MRSHIVSIGFLGVVFILLLSGCQLNQFTPEKINVQLKNGLNESAEISKPSLEARNDAGLKANDLQNKTELSQEVPNGFEVGKPKEEPVVEDSRSSHKLSRLQPIYSVGKGNVAITIDDGPTKQTGDLLKVLRENDAKVTFFLLGENAISYPQSVTEAVYDGHQIGYHSNSHPKMSQMTFSNQGKEFDLGLSKLKKLDRQPIILFRPPYGSYNNDTKLITEEHHMKMVLWNEDPRDWSTTDSAQIVKNVLAQVQSGSIIVLHDRSSTIAALPGIISGIRRMGLKMVKIQ